jgi:hypothetical protein
MGLEGLVSATRSSREACERERTVGAEFRFAYWNTYCLLRRFGALHRHRLAAEDLRRAGRFAANPELQVH